MRLHPESRKANRSSMPKRALIAAALWLPSAIALGVPSSAAAEDTVTIKLIETSDVHGSIFPVDLISRTPSHGSLARVHTYVEDERRRLGRDNVILLDNGDMLQGQPTVYYYNYIDTVTPHVTSEVMNFMGYNASTIGNHDVETGHAVYDRWAEGNNFPVLGANVIDTATGEPYFKPYTVFDVSGVKIAVLGMITPAIPGWLPENLWTGLRFDDIVETARRYVPKIIAKENPALIVALVHSGADSSKTTGDVIENAARLLAEQVGGIDIVFLGHDHQALLSSVNGPDGRTVLLLNPANGARLVAETEITFDVSDPAKPVISSVTPRAKSMDKVAVSQQFMERFSPQLDSVTAYVDRPIGEMARTITTRDAYFGPSAFIDLIHRIQLDITGAQVSMAAPLSFDAFINRGPVTVGDMFSLYKYENSLYTMKLSGQEIKDYLEMVYDQWTNTVSGPEEQLLRLKEGSSYDPTHTSFQYPSYNFDSASGIDYTVDVTQPKGSKITVVSMSDGTPFSPDSIYTVAINSYRGNGGGNLLTKGAGIPAAELKSRIVSSTPRDLRYYIIKYIEENPALDPQPAGNWKFIPEGITRPAFEREYKLLFPKS